MGNEFWHRLTGAEDFHDRLIYCLYEVIDNVDMTSLIEEVIQALSVEIEQYQDLADLTEPDINQ